MKKYEITFAKKELVFIIAAVILGFIISNPCLEWSDEPGLNGSSICEFRFFTNTTDLIFEVIRVWIILQIGRWLAMEVHSCSDELQKRGYRVIGK